jgi:hypothetical protein
MGDATTRLGSQYEEADSAGPVKWVVPAWEVLAADRGGWRAGLKRPKVNGSEVGVC